MAYFDRVTQSEREDAARQARAAQEAQEAKKKVESEFHDLSRLCATTGKKDACENFTEAWVKLVHYYNVINGVKTKKPLDDTRGREAI